MEPTYLEEQADAKRDFIQVRCLLLTDYQLPCGLCRPEMYALCNCFSTDDIQAASHANSDAMDGSFGGVLRARQRTGRPRHIWFLTMTVLGCRNAGMN